MGTRCSQGDCGKHVRRAGLCATHYKRKRLGKDMDAPIRTMGGDMENFWPKVDKSDSCWNWTAAKDKKGYGQFKHQGSMKLAHRVIYEWKNGPIPDGLLIDHMCHNHACVNPKHLRLADASRNAQNRAGARKGSKSGVRGVGWESREGRWKAAAVINGKRSFLGYFQTVAEAELVVTEWRRQNMPYSVMDQRKVS